MANPERSLTAAGGTLFAAYIGSVLLGLTAPTDSGQREFAYGALSATAWLTILWVIVAAPFAVLRWRALPWRFRTILLLNAAVVSLLVSEFIFH